MSIGKALMGAGNSKPIKWQSSKGFAHVDFKMFFDRAQVLSAFDKYEVRVLGRTGAFSRGFIRRSMRSGGKKGIKSEPYEPPRYHSRGPVSLKDGIFFMASLEEGAVIIGPRKLNTNVRPAGKASGAQLLEEGGVGHITSWRANKARPGKARPGRWKQRPARWKPRPYIAPAQKATNAKFIEFLKTTKL